MAGAVDRDNLAAAGGGIEAEAVAAESGRLAQAATAASTALPPARRISMAVSEAIGMEVAAMPFAA
jgi:hypothetical protein